MKKYFLISDDSIYNRSRNSSSQVHAPWYKTAKQRTNRAPIIYMLGMFLWRLKICFCKLVLRFVMNGQYGHCILGCLPHSALMCRCRFDFHVYTFPQLRQWWYGPRGSGPPVGYWCWSVILSFKPVSDRTSWNPWPNPE
jgi:hypothetical protein